MPKFTYKGKNLYGQLTEGVYEAPTEQAVTEMLKGQNYYVLEVKPLTESKDILDLEAYRKVPTKELMLFCKHFSVILKAGIPVIHALTMVDSQTENKTMKNVIAGIIKDIRTGASLTQAVKNNGEKLPILMIYMIEAGEASGTLDKTLDALYLHFEKTYNTQIKIKSALRYPKIVALVAVIVTVFLMVAIVPTFIRLFENNGIELPLPTKILIAVSNYTINYGFITVLAIAGVILVYKLYSSTSDGRLKVDKLKMMLPYVKENVQRGVAARFSRTMATLMVAGVGITEGLDISSRVVGNRYVSEQLQDIRRQVIAGKGITRPMKEAKCFPEMLENMIMMGEEAGTLEAMLENAANIYEEEIDNATQKVTDLIQPAILIVLGGIVGFIILAVALPLFSFY